MSTDDITIDATKVRIDPEFRALIAPLAAEEREQLEANLVAHGCRDPLALWRGVLIDGHNRYEICTRLGIAYRTVEIALSSREHVLLWIEENQFGRRNLSDDQRAAIGHAIKKRRAKIAMSERGKQGGRGHKKENLEATSASKLPSDRTRRAVAKEARVSEHKLRAVAEIEKAMPEAVAETRAGTKTVLEVKRAIREEQRERKREDNRKLLAATQSAEAIAFGAYGAVVIDPPWDWGDEGDDDQFGYARPNYATMPIDEIAALPISQIAAPDAHIYLWITNRSLPKGFGLLDKWGFRYVTQITWVKPSIGLGNYFRGATEQILFGVRGSLPLLVRDQATYFTAPRSGHSVKPPEFYQIVERCSPGPWIEMFARRQRKGWATWGAEVGGAA
jgi:N6-adenosine-specific RNA methylase IME4